MTNPHPLTEVEVTQADEQAADEFFDRTYGTYGDLTAILARHRLSTSAQPSTEAVLAEEPLELRPRDNGEFDEIVARFVGGMVHVETMSATSCYVGFYWNDGRILQWYINSARKLTYHHEVSHDDPVALSLSKAAKALR